jgi:NAD(P)-dependent dehydrogenase (short-subunit alcohol dehydrogenase family)
MQIQGRTAVITGGASGIGRAACDVFAGAGAHVVVVDLDEEATAATADAVGGTPVHGDVSDPALWDRVARIASDRGDLGVAYLNAGVYGHTGPIDALPLDVYERTIGANIGGVVLGTRALVPVLRAAGGGAIVVTASVAGIVAFEGNPLYTLTKQAVAGFVRAADTGLAADGISIDAVCPGVVDTPMTVEALGGASTDDLRISLIDPTDIARAALDLATSDGTGRCRAVRDSGGTVDWTFPGWADLARATAT